MFLKFKKETTLYKFKLLNKTDIIKHRTKYTDFMRSVFV